jgi:SAM-dependent methyltransferase
MHVELIDILRCPRTGERLKLDEARGSGERIESGTLVTVTSGHRYPIRNFIPRFVPASNYADNFGMQWNRFRQTQLDSHSGQPVSANRFWRATGWRPADLEGKWVLDIGCGAGRFAEIALGAGAKLIALDYSSAVDACYANLRHLPNLHVIQGDVYALPLPKAFFPYVYSLGVLQHTPDVERAFNALPAMVAPGGQLCVDYYWKRIRTMLHLKYLLRPITKRMPQQRLFSMLEASVPVMLPISRTLRRVPGVGRVLQRLVPVADYTGVYGLDEKQLHEWALLDTFDMLAPEYDNPQTEPTVRHWFERDGFLDVETFHEGHLVARGRKPA